MNIIKQHYNSFSYACLFSTRVQKSKLLKCILLILHQHTGLNKIVYLLILPLKIRTKVFPMVVASLMSQFKLRKQHTLH